MVNGSIDCFFIEENKIVICDYKTDRTDDISLSSEKYSKQLKIYAYAAEKFLNLLVKEKIIYSFYLENNIKT